MGRVLLIRIEATYGLVELRMLLTLDVFNGRRKGIALGDAKKHVIVAPTHSFPLL